MFVDKEAILPLNHRTPIGSGEIGAVGKMKIIQALHRKDGKGRHTTFTRTQNVRPVHSHSRTWNATQLRETHNVMLNEYFTI